AQIRIVTQPSASAAAGVAFPIQPVARLYFVSGDTDAVPGVVITTVIGSGGGTLGGTATATTDATGTATFTDLSIGGTIGERTLDFVAANYSSASSTAINLTAGLPTQLVIVTQPSSITANTFVLPQQPAIQLADAYGNAVHLAGFLVTATIAPQNG